MSGSGKQTRKELRRRVEELEAHLSTATRQLIDATRLLDQSEMMMRKMATDPVFYRTMQDAIVAIDAGATRVCVCGRCEAHEEQEISRR